MFLYVVKNADGSFRLVRIISSPINAKGNSGITYGDITNLDMVTRKAEGFWKQKDVYEGQGEFKIFKELVTTFDEDTLEMINTYVFEYMPLDDVKNDLKYRVDSKRDTLYVNGFTFDSHEYVTNSIFRTDIANIQGVIALDPTSFPASMIIKDINYDDVTFDKDAIIALSSALFLYTYGTRVKSRAIKLDIDSAISIEDAISKTKWDGVPL